MVFETPYNQADIQRAVERHAPTHDRGGEDELSGLVPVGGMIDWWGVAANVPIGWRLVDGTFEVNGFTVPDMAGKFARGAGGALALGDEGGAESHQHTPTTPDPLIHLQNHAEVAGHTHNSIPPQNLSHVQHSHLLDGTFYEVQLAGGSGAFVPRHGGAVGPTTVTQHSNTGGHQHTATGQPGGVHTHTSHDDHQPAAATDEASGTLPPYACFYKIMRVR